MQSQFSIAMQLLAGFVLLFIVGPFLGRMGGSFIIKILNGGAIIAGLILFFGSFVNMFRQKNKNKTNKS